MKDSTFKLVSKFFITLGIVYWICLILAATGCQTYEYDVKNKSHKTYEDVDKRLLELWFESSKYKDPNETTINLDPMDRTQWHERQEFLRHFE